MPHHSKHGVRGAPRHLTVKTPQNVGATGQRRTIVRSNLNEKRYH